MPNLGSVLKAEIQRLARKEVKAQTSVLKKASAQYRRDLAALKRSNSTLQKKVDFLESQEQKRVASFKPSVGSRTGKRFSASGVRSHRKRLKLSAAQYARLLGVSVQSVFGWELGRTIPKEEQLARLVAVRGMLQKEALARLEMLESVKQTKPKGKKKRKKKRKAKKKKR